MAKKKKEKYSFKIIYDPYSENDSDTFSDICKRYEADKNAVCEIDGLTYYHALQITKTSIKEHHYIVALCNKIGIKQYDSLIDENGQEYTITGFEMFHFSDGIPDWYSYYSFVLLLGNHEFIGTYFAIKSHETK